MAVAIGTPGAGRGPVLEGVWELARGSCFGHSARMTGVVRGRDGRPADAYRGRRGRRGMGNPMSLCLVTAVHAAGRVNRPMRRWMPSLALRAVYELKPTTVRVELMYLSFQDLSRGLRKEV